MNICSFCHLKLDLSCSKCAKKYCKTHKKSHEELCNKLTPVIPTDNLQVGLRCLEANYDLLISGHTDAIYCICLSSDEKKIATGGGDCSVRIWEISGRRQVMKHKHHLESVISVCISEDSSKVISGSHDKTIIIYSLAEKCLLKQLKGHKRIIKHVKINKNNTYIASSAGEKTLKLWNFQGDLINNLEGRSGSVKEFDLNNSSLVIGDSKFWVTIWSLTELTVVKSIFVNELICFIKINLNKFAVGTQTQFFIYDLEAQAGEENKELSCEVLVFAKSAVFSCDFESGKMDELTCFGTGVESVDTGSEVIVCGYSDRSIKVFNTQKDFLSIMDGHLGYVQLIKVFPYCKYLLSSGDDNIMRTWEISKGSQVSFVSHYCKIQSISITKSEKYFICTGVDLNSYVWKTAIAY